MTILPYTTDSLLGLYENLIGNAVVIQVVYTDVLLEENRYTLIDVWYSLAENWGIEVHGGDLTKRNMTMNDCIRYAEHCMKVIKIRGTMNY
jgi:hypothetical protein